jgi:hypothetical protein
MRCFWGRYEDWISMTAGDATPRTALMCLRVSTDGDPSVLTRVLGYFHNLNVTPRSVVAEFTSSHQLHVKVDVSGLSEARLTLIAAKVGENPSVLNAYWHYLV